VQIPLHLDPRAPQPLQAQLFDQLREFVLDGRLAPGMRLPSTRELAAALSIARNTVMAVYERLGAEGYVEARHGAGAFVSTTLPESALRGLRREPVPIDARRDDYAGPFRGERPSVYRPRSAANRIDFRVGKPDARMFPIRAWRQIAALSLRRARDELTQYNDPGGLPRLRDAVARHLRIARGIRADPTQVIIVAGVQAALNVIARLLLQPGARVVTESPTYEGAARAFSSYGARLVPVPVDGHGLIAGKLPRTGAALAYVTPSHQFPLGATLILERRLELLAWAEHTGAYVVEDDYDSDFRYESAPLTALQGLDRGERVLYTSTFSKSLGAGLRLGYVVVPPHLVEVATTVKALLDNGHPWLEQAILAEFIERGHFEHHLRRLRKACMLRRDALRNAILEHFPGSRVTGFEGGMHLVWQLPNDGADATTLQGAGARAGVGVYPLAQAHAHLYGNPTPYARTLALGYAALSEGEIRSGIRALARARG
jgi:GntR family transcriptional regulator/MocR family aminotransferase